MNTAKTVSVCGLTSGNLIALKTPRYVCFTQPIREPRLYRVIVVPSSDLLPPLCSRDKWNNPISRQTVGGNRGTATRNRKGIKGNMSDLKQSRRNDRWNENREERRQERGGTVADGYVFTFGKHKGMSITNVPKNYLMWMIGQDFHEQVLNAAHKELLRRGKLAATVKTGESSTVPVENKHVKASGAVAETTETHYQWNGPTGRMEWIPIDVDMSGRECEMVPF